MLKKAKKKYKCPNCGELGCYDHCAMCGIDIIWKPRGLDPDVLYTGIRPLRADNEQPHNFDICEQERIRQFPRIKASVIICPHHYCAVTVTDDKASEDPKVEPTDMLITLLNEHLRLQHGTRLKPESIDRILSAILRMRTFAKIHYTDPFLYVSDEEIEKIEEISA